MISGFSRLLSAIAITACGIMAVHIFIDIVFRQIFGITLFGTVLFVSNYYMIAIAALPLALVELNKKHISVELVTESLSPQRRRVVEGLSMAISFFISSALAYATFYEALEKYRIGTNIVEAGIRILIWPAHFVLATGIAMLAVVYLFRTVEYIRGSSSVDFSEGQK